VRRRAFITLLGGAAATWPLAARAQQAERVRRIGILTNLAEDDPEERARNAAFLQALQQLGWSEGRNLRIERRSGAGDAERIRRNAVELVALTPDVIVAAGSASLIPLLQVTRTVPVVFTIVPDPVGAGFVDTLAKPGGNATGFSQFEYGLSSKWLELLKEVAPGVTRVAVLREAGLTAAVAQLAALQAVAAAGRRAHSAQRARGSRDRSHRRCFRAFLRRWSDRDVGSVDGHLSRADHQRGGAAQTARSLRDAFHGDFRRVDVVRPGFRRSVSARRWLRRSHPQRREAGRPAGTGAHEV
jgi:hypothetical protein